MFHRFVSISPTEVVQVCVAPPLLKLVHQASKLLRGGGTVDVPHPAVQFVGLAAAVANLQNPCRKQSTTVIRGNNVWNAFCVDAQPSVLTVSGAYSGSTSRPSAANTP